MNQTYHSIYLLLQEPKIHGKTIVHMPKITMDYNVSSIDKKINRICIER
jgi:hypothetical protein